MGRYAQFLISDKKGRSFVSLTKGVKKVRIFLLFLLIFVLSSCSGNAETIDEAARLKQEVLQVIDQKLNQNEYSFQLRIHHQQQQQVFIGKQKGKEWEIHHKQYPKQKMKRQNGQIISTMSEREETWTSEEVGLVSPYDHFMFIKELKGDFKNLQPVNWNNQKAKQVQIQLDQKELSEKLKRRFFYEEEPVAVPLQGFNVYYTLIYLPNTQDMIQCTLTIDDGTNQQQLVIDFN